MTLKSEIMKIQEITFGLSLSIVIVMLGIYFF